MNVKNNNYPSIKEILNTLRAGPMTAYETAGRMHWDIAFESWEKLPGFQRWFATGEAIAHLNHLYHRGAVAVSDSTSKLLYSLAEGQ